MSGGTPIPLVEESCGLAIERLLPSVRGRTAKFEDVLTFCEAYRRVGVGRMFLMGLPDDLFTFLAHSANAFLFFADGKPQERYPASLLSPYFDALAAGMPAACGLHRTLCPQGAYARDRVRGRLPFHALSNGSAARTTRPQQSRSSSAAGAIW